jgi:hypothetical protein
MFIINKRGLVMKKRVKSSDKKNILERYLFFLAILVIITIVFLAGLGIFTGPQIQVHTQKIGVEFIEPNNYNWEPEQKGELYSVKISGKIKGIGDVRTYFNNLLIMDSSNVKSRITFTGAFVDAQEDDAVVLDEEIVPETNEQSLDSENNLSENGFEGAVETNDSLQVPVREFEDLCEETCNLSGMNDSSYDIRVELENASLELDEIKYEVAAQGTVEEAAVLESEEGLEEVNASEVEQANEAEIRTVQYKAVIGKPVKWKKTVDPSKEGRLEIGLPDDAENVVVKKIYSGEETLAQAAITGHSIAGFDSDSLIGIFLKLLKNIIEKRSMTGNAIEENLDVEITIDEAMAEYEVEYETPAPQAFEEEISENEKKIVISGPSDIHYTEVLAYTELPTQTGAERIKLYYMTETTKEEVSIDKYDTDNNGLIDYIEWIVPSLSNKTYGLVIEISEAEHLDNERRLVRSVYDQVKKEDDIWTETIMQGEYLRVKFEANLTKNNDIKIFARALGEEAAVIGVYAKDSDVLIAVFDEFSGKGIYKVFLTNLTQETDVFDLRLLEGNAEFDYVVDPSYTCAGTATACAGLNSVQCGVTAGDHQYGCYTNYACTGTPTWTCGVLDEASCGATIDDPQFGCYWSAGAGTCQGTIEDCENVRVDSCTQQIGCSKTFASCLGTVTSCGTFSSQQTECTNQLGCSWYKISCDGAYISCPSTATVGQSFNLTYGATSQSNPLSAYDTTSLRIFESGSQEVCNEFASGGSGVATGNKSSGIIESSAGTKTYTVYCYGAMDSVCGATTSDSTASCNVQVTGSSETNVTLSQGWNSFSLQMSNSTSGEKNISLNATWNLIGFSASSPFNITNINFTNSTGTRLNWTTAVSQGKVQAYLQYVQGGITKYLATADLEADDYAFRNGTGYFIKVNQRGNLTLSGVGGSATGATFNFSSLRFNNGTSEKNWTDARDAGWVFMSGLNEAYFWNETRSEYQTLCQSTLLCVQSTLESWEGYYIWSNKNNIVMIRRG